MDAELARRTEIVLSLLDDDLAAPYTGWDWQRVPLVDLMAMQQLRLMRAYLNKAASDTTTAATASQSESQPRSSLAAWWRRLTSISVRNQFPVFGFQPDQCSASSSSDIARNCAAVKVHFDDIDSFLAEVEGRIPKAPGWGDASVKDLSAIGHLIAVDVPRLMALVRALRCSAVPNCGWRNCGVACITKGKSLLLVAACLACDEGITLL